MSLRDATFRGVPLELPGNPPFASELLTPWIGKRITLPTADPWVRGTGDPEHAYLDGARNGWVDHPEYMDFLDAESPVHDLKQAEADLYWHHWAEQLNAPRVLDVGCGIGRLAARLLDRGATVFGVDPDLESLRRFAWHAAGRSGHLDLFWASVHALPSVEVDLAIASEVLCYVPDHVAALRAIAERLVPGGTLLVSVEARFGWAASQDAPAGTLEAALNDEGIVQVEGDRWVRTYDEPAIREWVAAAGLELQAAVPSHWIPDGPLEDIAPPALSLEELLELEGRCRAHPVWGPLHRLWLLTLRRP